jgi:hypothetical protein
MQTKYYLFLLLLLPAVRAVHGQAVYQHVSYTNIYDFLDEMANERIIELNSAVKPYTREFIAGKLTRIQDSSSLLNHRQQKELDFYFRDYHKELLPGKEYDKRFDLFYYKDSLFTFSLNPILGFQSWTHDSKGNFHRWNGAEIFAYVGKHLGIYASLRDNHEDKILSGPGYLNTRAGAVYKSGQDYSEMRGGITWSWKWGVLGLVKDHVEWGNNYHYPSILSSKAPSITQIKINLSPVRWFEFNYFHGWLNSGVVDSLRSYQYTNSYGTSTRRVYRKKFMAANIFTFKPMKGLHTSIGNSIIYSDMDAHPAYLIPFLLYKSVDHTNNNASSNEGGQNSQFFIDISSRQIRHLHLYATVYFDDISISRLRENGHMDYFSLNAGFQLSNLIPNTFLTLEYFKSYPLVYKHNMPTTTYESNFYNMGHYLQDNSKGLYGELGLRPVRGLDIRLSFNTAKHGRDHEELGTNRGDVVEMFMDSVTWKSRSFALEANYQVFNDIYLFAGYRHENNSGEIEKYTAAYFRGKTNTFSFGVNYGF